MRTLVPAETLVYLETNDLAAALQPIVDAKPFKEVAKSQPDLSALKGVQLAVAVLGFEATEEKLTDEQSVGSVKPRFVAVADTHAWNSTAVAFAERKLGSFVADIYGSEPKLEKSDKHGGKYFAWTAEDKRKAYALVIDGIVYFANDETSIDKCIAVRRGEADSILKTEKIKPSDPGTLARGYISNDGVNQIAALVGMKLASEASDESEVQTAIAGILPQLIRGTVTDITWTMIKTDQGIEDKYNVGMPQDVANVFSETMAPSGTTDEYFAKSLQLDYVSVTSYDLKDPLTAWNSVIENIRKQLNPDSIRILDAISPMVFEDYGIRDEKLYLASTGPIIRTSTGGKNGDEHHIRSDVKSVAGVTKSIIGPLTQKTYETHGYGEALFSNDDEFVAQFYDKEVVFGDNRMIIPDDLGPVFETQIRSLLSNSKPATSRTISTSSDDSLDICEILADCKPNTSQKSLTLTETRFTKSGMERRTVSDFGLIGQIIAQLGGED